MPATAPPGARLLEIGPGRMAHASGALWLPDCSTLLLADVHLGYGWALRRRGQLGPVGDDRVLRKLRHTIAELEPGHLVFLGDLVHAPKPAPGERATIEGVLEELAASARLTIVLGNHDRGLVRDFPGLPAAVCHSWRSPDHRLLAVHGDREVTETAEHVVLGHLHPALGIEDHAGASHRLAAFITTATATVIPAFSPLAAGCDIRDWWNADAPFALESARIAVTSGKRVADLGPADKALARAASDRR